MNIAYQMMMMVMVMVMVMMMMMMMSCLSFFTIFSQARECLEVIYEIGGRVLFDSQVRIRETERLWMFGGFMISETRC